eukprot:Pgem_evm1s7072
MDYINKITCSSEKLTARKQKRTLAVNKSIDFVLEKCAILYCIFAWALFSVIKYVSLKSLPILKKFENSSHAEGGSITALGVLFNRAVAYDCGFGQDHLSREFSSQ